MEPSDSNVLLFTFGNKCKRIQKNIQEIIEIISIDKNKEISEVKIEGESKNKSRNKNKQGSRIPTPAKESHRGRRYALTTSLTTKARSFIILVTELRKDPNGTPRVIGLM